MKIRKLNIKDINFMLEWMIDKDITSNFRTDFNSMTVEKIKKFIENSYTEENIHMAIVDENDEYLGTISLKNIDYINKNAEYAIVMRKKAIGTGVSKIATEQILKLAFEKLNLQRVYLNVYSNNKRAIKFYEKMNFKYEGEFKKHIFVDNYFKDFKWYSIIKEGAEVDFKELYFNQLGDDRGHLVVAESNKDIPFVIKRIFYIYGTEKDVVRGKHANRNSEFVIINIQGTSKVLIDNGREKHVVVLDKPHKGVYLNKMIWKDMYDFSQDSLLLVVCSEVYDSKEYIRDYNEFLKERAIEIH